MKDDTLTEVEITQTLREIVKKTESTGSGITVTTELSKETRLRTDKETLLMAVESALEHTASAVTVAVFFAGVAIRIGAWERVLVVVGYDSTC